MSEQTVKGELRVIPISVSKAIVPEEARRTTAGEYLVNALKEKGIEVQDKDVFVLTSKLVSLFDGRTINLSTVTPSRKAKILGKLFHKDPREVELIMREGKVLAVIPFKKLRKTPLYGSECSSFG